MKEILTKLAEVKKKIGKISKDSKNPFFNSKYFDINALLEHVEPLLVEYNLLLLQPIEDEAVVSRIYDVASGECMSSSKLLPILTDPQKMGSAITYYRRYTLQSLLGLQSEDDDGNKAAKITPPPPQKTTLSKDVFDKVLVVVKGQFPIDNNAGSFATKESYITFLKKNYALTENQLKELK